MWGRTQAPADSPPKAQPPASSAHITQLNFQCSMFNSFFSRPTRHNIQPSTPLHPYYTTPMQHNQLMPHALLKAFSPITWPTNTKRQSSSSKKIETSEHQSSFFLKRQKIYLIQKYNFHLTFICVSFLQINKKSKKMHNGYQCGKLEGNISAFRKIFLSGYQQAALLRSPVYYQMQLY